MKRIIIINGTYGYRPTGTYVEAKSAGDPPFSAADTEADRLIGMGIARLADTVDAPAAEEGPDGTEPTSDKLPEYSEKMKLTELKEIATAYGVDPSSMKSKKEVIEAIEASKADPAEGEPAATEDVDEGGDADTEDDVVDDGEAAPALSAAGPVN